MTDAQIAPAASGAAIDGIGLVALRPLASRGIEAAFPLSPGDRILVAAGQAVARDTPLAERLRDGRTIVVPGFEVAADHDQPGDRWSPPSTRRTNEGGTQEGELLFQSGDRWRIATGDVAETLVAPFAGIVSEVRPGIGLRLKTPAQAVLADTVFGGPSSGRLQVVTGADGEIRAPEVDVGAAGAILVAGAAIDAEALTRARAVGIRGVIVATLGVKERRDFLASERRGQAGAHGLPPFAILVLEGAVRRPIATPTMAILEALAGRTVAIVDDPPCLVVDDLEPALPLPPPGFVRVRAGPLIGAEGTGAGLAGPRRFPAGITLEAGLIRLGGRPPVAVPLGDLERFG